MKSLRFNKNENRKIPPLVTSPDVNLEWVHNVTLLTLYIRQTIEEM